MSMIPKHFINAVLSIGEQLPNGNHRWFASAFIVGEKVASDSNRSNIYLITNKHVVDRLDAILLRFNSKDGSGVKDMLCMLRNENGECFSRHPSQDIDIVACKLHGGNVQSVANLSWFDIDDNALTLSQMQSSGVDEGCFVYAIGFPMGIVNERIKAPIVRLGCISKIEDAFGGIGDSSYYVDAQVFPGNSGGPIVSRPELASVGNTNHNSRASLIGIVNSYIPYTDSLISRQTGKTVMVHRENSGLTNVFPVDRIKEVIQIEGERYRLSNANSIT